MASRKRTTAGPAKKKKARKQATAVKPAKTKSAKPKLKKTARATRSVQTFDAPAPRLKVLTRGAALGRDATFAVKPALSATLTLPGTCLSLKDAASIVLRVAGNPAQGMSASLEQAGFIAPTQRLAFRGGVREQVRASGCDIDAAEIPNGATTTLAEVRDAVQSRAR